MSIDLKQFMTNQPKALSDESWYIASPYSHDDPVIVRERVAAAKRVEAFMAETYGCTTVYVPIANTTEQQKRGVKPKKGWYLYDFDRLNTADRLIVLMLDEWEDSIGVALEIAFALGKGLDISYYTLEELISDEVPF